MLLLLQKLARELQHYVVALAKLNALHQLDALLAIVCVLEPQRIVILLMRLIVQTKKAANGNRA
jgi:hypothetical protein